MPKICAFDCVNCNFKKIVFIQEEITRKVLEGEVGTWKLFLGLP